MNPRRKRRILSAAATLAVVIGFNSFALAKSSERRATDALMEEIIITGTKKSAGQALQEAPVAVTVVNSEILELTKVTTIESLSYSVPNVGFDITSGAPVVANFSMRGYGVNSTVPSVEPAVGVVLDGVYMGNIFGIMTDLFDVESVELLRGPQGLLFGRNVTAGAALINSARPEEEFSGYLSARFQEGLDQTYKGAVTGSLTDNLSGRLGIYYRDDAGWFKNDSDFSSRVGRSEIFVIKPSLTFAPTENSSHTLMIEYGEHDGDGSVTRTPLLFEGHEVGIDPTITDMEWGRAVLESTWNVSFGEGVITNILGYREVEGVAGIDADSSPAFLVNFYQVLDQDQWSNELRYNGMFGRAEVTSGVYYFQQDMKASSAFEGLSTAVNAGNLDHTSIGIYTQIDYRVSDSVIVTVGGRYDYEEKDVEVSPSALGACTNTLFPNFKTTCSAFFEEGDDWSYFTPKVGLTWEVRDDVRVYAHYAKGFRSGGFNLRQTGGLQDPNGNVVGSEPAFDEEEHQSFEVGLKSQFNDGRTRLNAAFFYSDVSDYQLQALFDHDNDPDTIDVQTTTNAADAEMIGVEFELTQQLWDSLVADINFGYLDTELKNIQEAALVTGVFEGARTIRSPEYTVSVNLTHDWAFGQGGNLVTRLSYAYRDEWFSEEQTFPVIEDSNQFHAFLTYYSPGSRWSVSAFCKNIGNEELLSSSTDSLLGIDGVRPGRTFGGEIRYDFF